MTSPASYNQALLNEKFVYYCLFLPLTLGVIAAVLHIALDVDRVDFDGNTLELQPKGRIFNGSKNILRRAVIASVAGIFLFPLAYFMARPFFWTILVAIVRSFVKLHHSKSWTYTGLSIDFGLVFNTFLYVFVLAFGWTFANMTFEIYMSMSPVFRGEFLTNKSSNRNATLIDGLKHREKQLGSMLAYLELAKISSESESRRTLLFEDIEGRPTAWDKVKTELVFNLTDLIERLKKKTKKRCESNKAGSHTQDELKLKQQERGADTASLITIKSANVFASAPRGQTHLIESIQDKEAKSSASVVSLVDLLSTKIRKFVRTYPKVLEIVTRSKYGYPFRFTLKRQVHRLLPNPLLTSASIYSLGMLVMHSREEDRFGVVQGSIPEILDKLVETLDVLKKYVDKPPKHWSDQAGKPLGKGSVETQEQKQKRIEQDTEALKDMIEVLDVAESQITNIISTFYTNLDDLKLSDRVWGYIKHKQNEQVLDEAVYMDKDNVVLMEQIK